MTISVKVIEDTLSPHGVRITTLQLRYPRIIHAELLTHRVFSRNSSSSRAIPVKRLIQDVIDDPFIPRYWGKNQPGMQAGEEMSESDIHIAKRLLNEQKDLAVNTAKALAALGTHKQIVNRILEPYSHISVVLTATEWQNFFDLRMHEDAEPHMQELAVAMYDCLIAHNPIISYKGSNDHTCWHLPYIGIAERWEQPLGTLLKVSVARCARVSYLKHDGEPSSIEEDTALYYKLVGSTPLHASPVEHQAHCDTFATTRSRNFVGWIQHREIVENELYGR